MKVILAQTGQEIEVEGAKTVQAVLSKLEINPETVLVLRDGRLVTRDEPVADEAKLEVLPVISGGRDLRGIS